MVWGYITSRRVGQLHRIIGNMDSTQYVEILEQSFLSTLKKYHLKSNGIFFQQDKDPKHTSKKAQSWFQNHHITLLDWAPSSPDMNIIEHVWGYLERRINAQRIKPRNADEMWVILEKEWNNIDINYIKSLYSSMPHRVDALWQVKGGYTKY